MEEMAKIEADRVAKQRESLGEAGLIEKATILDHATEENEVVSLNFVREIPPFITYYESICSSILT